MNDRFLGRFDDVIYDQETGFEWIAGPDVATPWPVAKKWAEDMYTDRKNWRMPTKEELKTLYQLGLGKCNISPLFEMRECYEQPRGIFVWSIERRGSMNAWGFHFEKGDYRWANCKSDAFRRGFAVRG